MSKPFAFVFFLLVFVVGTIPALAQEAAVPTNEPVRLVLTDGSTLRGVVERQEAGVLHFRTVSGVSMTLAREQIRSIEALEGEFVEGEYRMLDPNRTRLFFAPTARPLGTGRGYFATYEVFFPFVAVGASRAISLAGGFSLLPGISEQLVYVAPKVTFVNGRRASAAAGVLVGTVLGETGVGGLVYGIGTVGGSYRAVTFGLGLPFGGGDFGRYPVIVLGGEVQVSNAIKLLSENYVIVDADDGTVVLSGGLRFFGERLAADLGLFTSPDAFGEGGFPFFPWVGFAYNFGR